MSVTQKEIVQALRENFMLYYKDQMLVTESELADRIEREGIAPPDGYAIVPIDAVVNAIADLQPLGFSQNRGDRLWQLYRTPEECLAAIRKAMLTAAKESPTPPLLITTPQLNDETYRMESK